MKISRSYEGVAFRWDYVWLNLYPDFRNWRIGFCVDWLYWDDVKKTWRRITFNLLFLTLSVEFFSKGYWDGCVRKPGLYIRIPLKETIKEI